MQLFSSFGRLADHLLEEYWARLKARRAYLTYTFCLVLMVASAKGHLNLLAPLSFLSLWFMYVVLGPHENKGIK